MCFLWYVRLWQWEYGALFFFAYIFFLKLRKKMQIGAFADIYMAKK